MGDAQTLHPLNTWNSQSLWNVTVSWSTILALLVDSVDVCAARCWSVGAQLRLIEVLHSNTPPRHLSAAKTAKAPS